MITARETVVNVQYAQTGRSTQSDAMGMREMQARAFAKRDSLYLLIKAPPACGKSRALMFLALDKVLHQGLSKVIVAVPQMAIGSSFSNTDLKSHGFFADWEIDPRYNLCIPGTEQSKAKVVEAFLHDADAHYLVCTHATLINFYLNKLQDKSLFNQALVAIDELHHASADDGNRLGGVLHSLIYDTTAHIVAMTGSYFRGDRIPVLEAEDEALFDKVTYTYYEQLNGYKYLKSLGIDYAFYQGKWTDAIAEILDPNKKTIIHIPSVNSRESTKDKINEVGYVLDVIGENLGRDPETGIYTVKRKDGRLLRVADLVSDLQPGMQGTALSYLRKVKSRDDIDIIIALGMAKEGFDWPWCEHALTVGYRNSLTEVVQIIGRATRDVEGKTHAQFTNLIAKPEAMQTDVENAVNSLLKAITLSLLMEQVLAPNVHFRVRSKNPDNYDPAKNNNGSSSGSGSGTQGNKNDPAKDSDQDGGITVVIDDSEEHLSDAAAKILDEDMQDIISHIYNNTQEVGEAIFNGGTGVNELLLHDTLPQVLKELYPTKDLSDADIEAISQAVVLLLNRHKTPDTTKPSASDDNVAQHGKQGNLGIDEFDTNGGSDTDDSSDSAKKGRGGSGVVIVDNQALLKASDNFINVNDLDINMILRVNPFQDAYDFVSRNLDAPTLRKIQDKVVAKRSQVTEQEALSLFPFLDEFVKEHKHHPDLHSTDDFERRLAEVLAYLRAKKAQAMSKQKAR